MSLDFSAPISGLAAVQTRQNISAHDIANINTPGYEEYRPAQTDVVPQETRISSVSRTPGNSPESSNTDLAQETVEQMVNKQTYSADLKVIKAKDKMMGELLDIVG